MTQDDVIEMARQVGYPIQHPEWQKATEEFAALVAAKEREACAKVCESEWGKGYRDDGSDAWLAHDNAVYACAAAIRARGEQA